MKENDAEIYAYHIRLLCNMVTSEKIFGSKKLLIEDFKEIMKYENIHEIALLSITEDKKTCNVSSIKTDIDFLEFKEISKKISLDNHKVENLKDLLLNNKDAESERLSVIYNTNLKKKGIPEVGYDCIIMIYKNVFLGLDDISSDREFSTETLSKFITFSQLMSLKLKELSLIKENKELKQNNN